MLRQLTRRPLLTFIVYIQMDFGQPVCCKCEKDDSNYISPDSRMWYTPCNHALCDRCKQDLFGRHRLQKCPQKLCGATIAIQDLGTETRESREFEEEKRVRKRLSNIFTKTLADFGDDSAAYDTYLEQFERYVQALVQGNEQERAQVEAAIAAYRAKHQHQISSSVARSHAVEQREREKHRQEEEVRSAVASASIAAESRRKLLEVSFKAHVMNTLLSSESGAPSRQGMGAGDEDGITRVRALRQQLMRLQAQKAADTSAEGISMWFVPCPHVAPPRFLGYAHADWHEVHGRALVQAAQQGGGASAWDKAGASLPAHARAGGCTPEVYAHFMAEDMRSMLWG